MLRFERSDLALLMFYICVHLCPFVVSIIMFGSVQEHLQQQLDEIRAAGTYKHERILTTPQDAHVQVAGGKPVLNLCANNYLGLAEHPAVVKAAHETLERWGYGLSSVRFICGTQGIHKELEQKHI